MPFYEYACHDCKKITEKMRPMKVRNRQVKCDSCGKKIKRIMSMPAACYDPTKPFDFEPKAMGVNIARGNRTPAQQEKHYGKIIDDARKNVRRKTKDETTMRGELDRDDRMHMKARIPRELYIARTRQFGKHYWSDEGEKALKRDNLLLE